MDSVVMRRSHVLIGALALAACGDGDRPEPRSEEASAAPRAASAASAAPGARGACPLRSHDVRVGVDSIGGLSTRLTAGELRTLCPAARLDTLGVGGTTAVALRWEAPGVTLWAIQSEHDPYGDSLRAGERPDLWAAAGDSVRFPDGVPVPRRIGALRTLDSAAVVVVDRGDDGTGSYVVRCRYPGLAVVVDNVWPPFADSGVAPFARAAPTDTTPVWRVEMEPGRRDSRAEHACTGARGG